MSDTFHLKVLRTIVKCASMLVFLFPCLVVARTTCCIVLLPPLSSTSHFLSMSQMSLCDHELCLYLQTSDCEPSMPTSGVPLVCTTSVSSNKHTSPPRHGVAVDCFPMHLAASPSFTIASTFGTPGVLSVRASRAYRSICAE